MFRKLEHCTHVFENHEVIIQEGALRLEQIPNCFSSFRFIFVEGSLGIVFGSFQHPLHPFQGTQIPQRRLFLRGRGYHRIFLDAVTKVGWHGWGERVWAQRASSIVGGTRTTRRWRKLVDIHRKYFRSQAWR